MYIRMMLNIIRSYNKLYQGPWPPVFKPMLSFVRKWYVAWYVIATYITNICIQNIAMYIHM